MWLEKYLQTTKGVNPHKILVEHIRHFYKTNRFFAKLWLEMAVLDDALVKKYGVVCPNDGCNRIIKSYSDKNLIPEEITCELCEMTDKEISTYKTKDIEIIEYYQIKG